MTSFGRDPGSSASFGDPPRNAAPSSAAGSARSPRFASWNSGCPTNVPGTPRSPNHPGSNGSRHITWSLSRRIRPIRHDAHAQSCGPTRCTIAAPGRRFRTALHIDQFAAGLSVGTSAANSFSSSQRFTTPTRRQSSLASVAAPTSIFACPVVSSKSSAPASAIAGPPNATTRRPGSRRRNSAISRAANTSPLGSNTVNKIGFNSLIAESVRNGRGVPRGSSVAGRGIAVGQGLRLSSSDATGRRVPHLAGFAAMCA